ncbi:MAG: bifunctional folylpolyglutamate synthase/dihydrofolate synthase [Deltaproteobacteria bacterium]|nr:bifunctional folylpolyglutamate synthase/dihydrofolate synthase [Deltaproteobacteria bacterium]
MKPPPPRYIDLLAHLERARAAGVDLGLERTRAVLDRVGNPQRGITTVHIAGTNGKGSTAAMTDAILRAAGLRTGLYTSPHLSRFTERIRVDGREADGDLLAALEPRIAATGIPLTYFEIATVLAFLTFAEMGVDVVVAETGLGGRLDATTTCEPVATAITSIAFDHAELLGATLAKIAREKAGIAKAGVPLFLAPVAPEADGAIASVAAAVGAPLRRLGTDFALPDASSVGLWGAHQRTNAALAVALAQTAAAACRGTSAGGALQTQAIETGLRDVVWPGRLEWVAQDVLLDCAHNIEGAVALAETLDRMPERRPRALVFSAVAGKPVAAMLRILAPRFDGIFLTCSSNPRSLSTEVLMNMLAESVRAARDVGDVRKVSDPASAVDLVALMSKTQAIEDPVAALVAARESFAKSFDTSFGQSGLVVAAGSTFLIGDLRASLRGEWRDPILTSDPVSRGI